MFKSVTPVELFADGLEEVLVPRPVKVSKQILHIGIKVRRRRVATPSGTLVVRVFIFRISDTVTVVAEKSHLVFLEFLALEKFRQT